MRIAQFVRIVFSLNRFVYCQIELVPISVCPQKPYRHNFSCETLRYVHFSADIHEEAASLEPSRSRELTLIMRGLLLNHLFSLTISPLSYNFYMPCLDRRVLPALGNGGIVVTSGSVSTRLDMNSGVI